MAASDHGHLLGEKDFTAKIPYGLQPCLLDPILLIRHPEGKGAGKSVDASVYNPDILTTVCNLIGEKIPEWTEKRISVHWVKERLRRSVITQAAFTDTTSRFVMRTMPWCTG